MGDIATSSRQWAARDPLVEHVVVPGAAHTSNQDNPAAFTAALAAFLDRALPADHRPGPVRRLLGAVSRLSGHRSQKRFRDRGR